MTEKSLKPGWRRVKFGEVVQLSKARSPDPLAEGIERYVGLEHLEPGDLRIRRWGNVADGVTFTSVFHPGQVLFGKRRAYQRKVAVADFSGVCSGDIYVLETKDSEVLLPELLPYICQTDEFLGYAVGTSAGSLSPRTNWSSLKDFKITLLPLEEQWRLVEVLHQVEVALDALSAAEVAASSLIASLSMDLMVPMPGDLRAGWSFRSIRDVCSTKSDLIIGPFGSNLMKLDYEGRDSGVPVVFVRDIRPNSFNYISNCYVTEEKAKDLRAHGAEAGDVLITKVGVPESMGTPPGLAAVVPEKFPLSIVTADVVRVRADEKVMIRRYLCYLLNTVWGRRETWRISPGSTTRFKMTLASLSALRIPVPPIKCQETTISKLDEAWLARESLRHRRRQVAEIKARLLSLLQGTG
jgi:type I restriction enzyme S subunit